MLEADEELNLQYRDVQAVPFSLSDALEGGLSKRVYKYFSPGIEKCLGLQQLNAVYRHWITTGRPFVIVKGAMTLDGKIATRTGQSKWITGDLARQDVHRVRSQVDAVMVG